MENWGLRQELTLSTSKAYKVTFSAKQLTGVGEMYSGLGRTASPFFSQVITSEFVEYSFVQTPSDIDAPYDTVHFGGKLATGAEVTNTFEVKDVSAQEMALTKIFPELAPPDIDAPYIVYSVVSNSPSDTKNANGDIDTANIEVYGFQTTYNLAVDLGVSVRAALDRKTGTYNTIEIQSTNYVNEQMDVNEARKLWAAIQDYSIRIKNI